MAGGATPGAGTPEVTVNGLLCFNESAATEEIELFEENGEVVIVVVTAVLMLTFVIGNCLHRNHISFLPESLVVIGLGALLGWAFKAFPELPDISVGGESVINATVLNFFLLPIIIFEAGWSLRHKDFVSQLGYILIFAIFGTLISTGVVAALIVATSGIHGIGRWRTACAYAALISAVDPVATLSTYASLNVEPLLNTLVFGESVINDAVAIVLFKVFNQASVEAYRRQSYEHMAEQIHRGVFGLLFGSIGLGLALGCIYILIMRCGRMNHSPALVILFIFLCSFFTYSFTEAVCKMSGIIAVLFCAMLMSGYAPPHISVEGNLLASFLLKQMASLADVSVFLFVGISAVFVSSRGLAFGGLVMVFCMVGRFCAILPLGLLANAIKAVVGKHLPEDKRHMLSWRHLFMMWHAGLRGGIALVLTLELGEWVDRIDGPGTREVLRNGTVVVICTFLFVFGGTTELLLRALGISMGKGVAMYHEYGWCMRRLHRLHAGIVVPVLVGGRRADLHMEGGVVTEVLERARSPEADARAEVPGLGTGKIRTFARRTFRLFGTMDPAGVTQSDDLDKALAAGTRDGDESDSSGTASE